MNGDKKIILVAEDEHVNYFIIKTVVSKMNQGIETIHADNGLKAVEELKGNSQISMVLMDIKMPVMDGFEATAEIRKFNKDIPVIAQTAYASEEFKKKALMVGCNKFLSKPVNLKELGMIIKEFS